MSNKSLLSYNGLVQLIIQGVLQHGEMDHINSASIDIRLGAKVIVERARAPMGYSGEALTEYTPEYLHTVSLKNKDALIGATFDLTRDGPITLYPGEFILAQSYEIFHLPRHISCEYKLKSSMARIGLEHLNAGWCDAGWHGSVLTLELKNMTRCHCIELNYLDKIGQVVFFQHEEVPESKSYAVRGRYNGDTEVTGAKKDPVLPTEPTKCEGCEE